MILRVKLLGSGRPGDPYRVNLPTYELVHGNITHGYALVNVPDDAHGQGAEQLDGETVEATTDGDFYPSLSDAAVQSIHDHFDSHYEEHAGEFRIEQA